MMSSLFDFSLGSMVIGESGELCLCPNMPLVFGGVVSTRYIESLLKRPVS
jgi:hypothetical protein